MYGEAPKELYLSKEQKVKKMSEIDPNEETTEKISALEKVTKAELNKCNTIEDKMEWLGKVLGQAIFENDMNYAVWVNVQKNNIIEQLKKENEQLKAYESHWKEIEEDAKVIAKENAELKEKLDKIRNYLVYDIFDRFKYLENLIKISQETQAENLKAIVTDFNKANEWHKSDIPTSQINKVVLGYIKDYNSKMFCLVKWNGEWWYDARTYNERVKLIAWCEIPTFTDKE